MWFNELKGDRVEMDVTVFSRREDGAFCRADEHHTQYIHESGALRAAAEGAGFRICAEEGACGDPADRMRRSFLCVKGEKERR